MDFFNVSDDLDAFQYWDDSDYNIWVNNGRNDDDAEYVYSLELTNVNENIDLTPFKHLDILHLTSNIDGDGFDLIINTLNDNIEELYL